MASVPGGFELFDGPNGGLLAVCIGILVVIVTIILLFVLRKGARKGNRVLLVGLTDAGKTLLFSRLTSGNYVMTHTSMKENQGYCTVNTGKKVRSVEVVDLPGFDRIRGQFLDKQKGQERAVIFVVDSVNFPREIKDVAEQMYDILSTKTITQAAVPVLVACNKQDMTTAKSARVIKTQLEREINTQRITRSAALQGTDGSSSGVFVGKKGKDFEFSHVSPIKVEFAECSCKGETDNQPDIKAVLQWLERID